MCLRTFDSPTHVEAEDVVGALPDGVHLSVAKQPRDRPRLDIAVTAVDFDRIRCHGDAEPAHLQLRDGHGDALPHLAGLTVVRRAGAVEHQGLGGFHVNDHLGQLATHQRLVDQCIAEGVPSACVAQRLDQGPPRVPEGEQCDAKACGVRQLHHPAEPLAVGRARVVARFTGQQERFGVNELDFPGGHRASAEFVLEAANPDAVSGAVATRPQHEERRDAAAGVRRPFGFGQHDERLAVAVRRKPLEPVELPGVAVACRRRLQRAQIGPTRALRQKLRGFALPLPRLEFRQHVIAHIGRRVGGDQGLHHAAAGPQCASHADVGLIEQIVGREQRQRCAHPARRASPRNAFCASRTVLRDSANEVGITTRLTSWPHRS